jgi:hypothetical protein
VQPEPAKRESPAEPKPAGLFAGLSQIEARKLWAKGQTLAALSLALAAESLPESIGAAEAEPAL